MRTFYTFVFSLAVIVNRLECSSQSASNCHSERHPSSPTSPAENLFLLAECCAKIDDTSICEDDPARARSRSPVGTHAPVTVLGYSLRELGYVRLIPCTNKRIQFEFRRYRFPAVKSIRVRADQNRRVPVPTQEQIVLSLSNGDIFALLDSFGFLSAIYRTEKPHPRVKLNMLSGEINDLTRDEMKDCPVGKNEQIFSRNFIKTRSRNDSLQSLWNSCSEPQEAPPRVHMTRYFTSRPPPDRVLGFDMRKLGLVRLIPCTNPYQRFEFRRYVFPTVDKKIRIRIDNVNYSYEPNQEYMVLSTVDGDVYALLDHGDTLRALYMSYSTNSRIKLNMMSGKVTDMNPDEIRDCPVGKKNPIFPNNFNKAFVNHDSLQFTWRPHDEGNPTSSSSASQRSAEKSPPGRPPSHDVLGYSLAELGYIRLIPQANNDERFEFRRYVFPPKKPIRLMLVKGAYVPLPIREHIVLSKSNGDVLAILEYTGLLRGLYATNTNRWRMKINMASGRVEQMTEMELSECHIGVNHPIFPRYFRAEVSNEDSLQHVYH